MINVDLLQRTLAHIETNPELWVQNDWMTPAPCGTAYCFAGWAVTLNGAEIKVGWNVVAVLPEGDMHNIDLYAADLLGIEHTRIEDFGDDDDDDIPLFQAHNTLDDLRRIVDELIAEAVQ